MPDHIIYDAFDDATAHANYVTTHTGRYWTAIPYQGSWIITDRYHPKG